MRAHMDAADELARIRSLRLTERRRRYQRSKLVAFERELLALRAANGSLRDLCRWLKEKRIRCSPSTVWRFLRTADARSGKTGEVPVYSDVDVPFD